MKDEELNALERDSKALRDPKDRAEALKALTELRAADAELKKVQAKFELERKAAVRTALRSSDFKNYSIGKFVKLLFGAVAFLALCASLIFLALPVGHLIEGDTSGGTFTLLAIALSAVAASATILHLLSRKSEKEREALERNPVARQFAKQKLLFQLSALGLFAFTVLAIVLTASFLKKYSVAPYILSFSFLFVYWLLGRKFWRCPGCGAQLSFMNRHRDRQSIQNCPSCHATLQ